MKIEIDTEGLITQMNEVLTTTTERFKQNCADFILSAAQKNLREEEATQAFDTGELTRSGVAIVEEDAVIVGFSAPYAEDVEWGRDPGSMPPVKAIAEWAKRKGISDSEGVAWAIAKAIEKNGIRAKPFMRNAYEKLLRNLDRIWQETIQEVI